MNKKKKITSLHSRATIYLPTIFAIEHENKEIKKWFLVSSKASDMG